MYTGTVMLIVNTIYKCAYVYVYVCTYIYIYIHMYVYAHV